MAAFSPTTHQSSLLGLSQWDQRAALDEAVRSDMTVFKFFGTDHHTGPVLVGPGYVACFIPYTNKEDFPKSKHLLLLMPQLVARCLYVSHKRIKTIAMQCNISPVLRRQQFLALVKDLAMLCPDITDVAESLVDLWMQKSWGGEGPPKDSHEPSKRVHTLLTDYLSLDLPYCTQSEVEFSPKGPLEENAAVFDQLFSRFGPFWEELYTHTQSPRQNHLRASSGKSLYRSIR
jgi:hypothetical protein